MKKTSSEILKSSALSVTEGRKTILDIFLSSVSAMAHQDIESKCKEEYDRVTIYRTLQTFLEKGIIHTIPSSDNITRYALCNDDCIDSGHHHDNHVHFSCNACGKTICLDDTAIPSVHLPKGFRANQINMIVSGVCKTCA
ncbi:MAG: Fur family transcriptional regulator [Chitinophagaceae bacterium]|jgi:Fur family ferric uptake transcriptional regulator